MKILFVGRLFSGLETSLLSRNWEPTGAPTVFKVIEALDSSPNEARLVLTCKDGPSSWLEKNDKTIALNGLSTPIRVLSGINAIPTFFGPMRPHLSELRHMCKIWQEARAFQPDVIYLGNANIWSGAFLAHLGKAPVIFRMMGVYPAMRKALQGFRLTHLFLRWCYRAPYAAAICTQDGSGIERWLEAALKPNVDKVAWVNGVDIPPAPDEISPQLQGLPDNKTIVLFIGHLESLKGCDVFLDAVLSALSERPDEIHALMIGTGSRLAALNEKVKNAEQEANVTFINRLPHIQIAEAHRRADIYVSLNRLGNLSNANLEAMRQGQCIILPRAQPYLGIDTVTDYLIPEDAALRIKDADDMAGLASAIANLHESPARRKAQAKALAEAAQKFVPSWDDRIENEITLLEHIATGNPVASFSEHSNA